MNDETLKTVEFDIRGQICPATLLVALREINRHYAELQSGQLQLMFRTDNRQAINTIPESAGNMGLNCSVEKSADGYVLAIFR